MTVCLSLLMKKVQKFAPKYLPTSLKTQTDFNVKWGFPFALSAEKKKRALDLFLALSATCLYSQSKNELSDIKGM